MRAAWPVVALVSAAAMLRWFPPSTYHMYPQCPVWEYLHLKCPGCGATRALAALLHGDLASAWRWNALFVALLPVMVLYGAEWYRGYLRGVRSQRQISIVAISCLLALTIVFGLIRNLPGSDL